MKIPFSLQPRQTIEPASFVLLPSANAADLFALVDQLELDSLPNVYATADGYLCMLPKVVETPVAGVMRLRRLADHLLIPVDADLVPPLLPDEAQGLTRARGLVFLPGPRVLEFTPRQPLTWTSLLDVPKLDASNWQSLPEAPTLADELLELRSIVPVPPAELVLEMGRDDICTETPGPQKGDAGLGGKIAGGAAYAAGKSLVWLGTKLGLGSLASAGANLLQKAFDRIPVLSQRLMGAQEATLRDLLRDFREGNVEKALRRALPLGGSTSKPVAPSPNAQLPTHNLFHSLQNLLSGRQGSGSLWFTPDDVYHSLHAEYRKQAEMAAQRGDYRRAAFIYAKLLNDMGGAARLLSQGGLHRDAAVIYEKALHNSRAAAHEWEAAGEIDQAVEVLVRIGDELAAAELLRKVGEAPRALVHFRSAAAKLAAQNKYFEAGELYRLKAQRPDLALEMFRAGWLTRPQLSAQPCGLSLAEHFAQAPNPTRFLQLLDDTEVCIPIWTAESTVQFFNQMARLASRPALAPVTEAARDRCLLALARKMTPSGRGDGAGASSRYFPADSPWPTPVVRDAEFALNLVKPSRDVAGPTPMVRLGNSTIRAVCHMPMSGDLFLGFENGEIVHFRMASGNVATLTKQPGPILGLVADADEQHLVALVETKSNTHTLLVGSRAFHFRFEGLAQVGALPPTRFCAVVDNHVSPFLGVLSQSVCFLHRRDNPVWSRSFSMALGDGPLAGVVGRMPGASDTPWCVLFFANRGFFLIDEQLTLEFPVPAPPGHPQRSTLHQPPVQAWLANPITVVIHWVTKDAELYSMSVVLDAKAAQTPQPERLATANPVLGVYGCIDCRLAMKDRTNLWDCLHEQWNSRDSWYNPIAAFRLESGEIVVIEANGVLTRLPPSK